MPAADQQQILVYGDSLTWGIIPDTRRRLPFAARWPGIMEAALHAAGHPVRVIEDCLNGRRTAWDDTAASRVDGVHLDADQHQTLGEALARAVAHLL